MMPILSANALSLSINGKDVCNGLDWAVNSGEVWGVLGVNGVGKSTLLHALSGLYPVDSGELGLSGELIDQMRRREVARMVGLLFQHQDDIFPTTVEEMVRMGRHPHTSLLRGEQTEDLDIVQQIMVQMGLSGMEGRLVDTLSGGERRRVAIATLLAQQPKLYLLDEPEAHLDPRYQQEILTHVVQETAERRAALVMVLHDINLAIHHCTHLLMLMGDGIVEQGDVETMISTDRVGRLYGTEMTRIEEGGRIAYLPC